MGKEEKPSKACRQVSLKHDTSHLFFIYYSLLVTSLNPQERAGVKMVMIQDGPQNTGADKPLRISGEPFKVQVGFVYFVVSL